MKKFKLKLWQRSLLLCRVTSLIFGLSTGLFYILKKKRLTFSFFSWKSLKNNLYELKDISKYQMFFGDPITKKKINNYYHKNNTNDYKNKLRSNLLGID